MANVDLSHFRECCGDLFTPTPSSPALDLDQAVEYDEELIGFQTQFTAEVQRRRTLFASLTRSAKGESTTLALEAKNLAKGLANTPGLGDSKFTKWHMRLFNVLCSEEFQKTKGLKNKVGIIFHHVARYSAFDWLTKLGWTQNLWACLEDLVRKFIGPEKLFLAVSLMLTALSIYKKGYNKETLQSILLNAAKFAVIWWTPWFFSIPINRSIDEIEDGIKYGDGIGTIAWSVAVSIPFIGWGLDALFPDQPLPVISADNIHEDIFIHDEMFDPVSLTPLVDPVLVQGMVFSRATIERILANPRQSLHRNPLTQARISSVHVRELPKKMGQKYLRYMNRRHSIISRFHEQASSHI
eukprot:CAMPEP_0175111050 /NCGR_PEP_ID=MMETSP0086_2-20121207/14505_1 /TAXON_ID=136419 /ORGANISM="Unknown Unknown, Strain D1" /LENGTH=353 /DNA_ID=CAMNT_0016389385 /DNA_START=31 /DNA_END=1092 /DNA_ORIENTATION=+